MRRAAFLLLLAGCAGEPPEPPPPIEPAASGGALYVIDTSLDCFDVLGVGSVPGISADPSLPRVLWVGEQALGILLRVAGRGKEARLLGNSRAELASARPSQFKVSWYGDPFEMGRWNRPVWIAMEATPVLWSDGKYATLEISVRESPSSAKDPAGRAIDAGNVSDAVPRGPHVIPIGSALAVSIPRSGDRILLLVLHVASVDRR